MLCWPPARCEYCVAEPTSVRQEAGWWPVAQLLTLGGTAATLNSYSGGSLEEDL